MCLVFRVTGGSAVTATLRYDDNGNLKKLCEAGSGSVSGTATDCTASGTGSQATAYTWNGLDQLISLAKAGTATLNEAYAYDAAGRRLAKTSAGITTAYLYDGEAILGEWNGAVAGAPSAVYAQGGTDDPLMRLSGNSGGTDASVRTYAQDGIGSVTALLASGTVANQSQQAGNTLATTGDYSSATYPGSQLKDGVTATSNSTGWVGVVASGAAVSVTLAIPAAIDHVDLMAVSNYLPSAFVVEAQNPDTTWTQVASGSNADFSATGDGSSVHTQKTFTPVSTGAIRIRFTGAVNSGLVWLTEVQVWSAAGSAVTQRFDAWGNLLQATGSIPTYGYTGREPDASGLIFYRARYYHPGLGRFVSRDPIGMQGGINPYAYAGGNPVLYNDPSGLLISNAANTVVDYAGRAASSFDAAKSNAQTAFQSGYNSLLDSLPGARPVDSNGSLTLGEANYQYRHGAGQPVTVDLNKIDFSGVSAAKAKAKASPGGISYITPSSTNDFLVHGTVGVRVQPNQTITAPQGPYDFDMHKLTGDLSVKGFVDNVKTAIRNVETLIGNAVAGFGTPYPINYGGQGKVGKP